MTAGGRAYHTPSEKFAKATHLTVSVRNQTRIAVDKSPFHLWANRGWVFVVLADTGT